MTLEDNPNNNKAKNRYRNVSVFFIRFIFNEKNTLLFLFFLFVQLNAQEKDSLLVNFNNSIQNATTKVRKDKSFNFCL